MKAINEANLAELGQGDVREQFKTWVRAFNDVDTKAATLAPRFMQAFKEWKGTDEKRDLSAFVRHLYDFDTKLKDTDEIKHAIQRANYLKRLTEPKKTKPEPETQREQAEGQENATPAPTDEDKVAQALQVLLDYADDQQQAATMLGAIKWKGLLGLKVQGVLTAFVRKEAA
jgi:hypothetical protein